MSRLFDSERCGVDGTGQPSTVRRCVLAASIGLLAFVSFLFLMALIVRNVELPEQSPGTAVSSSPLTAFLQQVSGKLVTTDFLVDYASAVAAVHREDPYQWSSAIFAEYGLPDWPVNTANPHPPTMVAAAIPFTLLSYQNALALWATLMVAATIGTLTLMGVRAVLAVPIGIALCLVSPGAYGIGNVVPLIGLGIALAWRCRDSPVLAAAGLTLAATPKASGLILLLPFIASCRFRVAGWTALFMAVMSLIPVVFYPTTWSRYLQDGLAAITANAARGDNASILHLATTFGVPTVVSAGVVVVVAAVMMIAIRDIFWPTVWLVVALLPIAWMYSLLTLIPLYCAALRDRSVLAMGSAGLAVGLAAATPPYGMAPTHVWPVILGLAAVAVTQIRETGFPPSIGRLILGARATSPLRGGIRAPGSRAPAATRGPARPAAPGR